MTEEVIDEESENRTLFVVNLRGRQEMSHGLEGRKYRVECVLFFNKYKRFSLANKRNKRNYFEKNFGMCCYRKTINLGLPLLFCYNSTPKCVIIDLFYSLKNSDKQNCYQVEGDKLPLLFLMI